MTIYFPWIFFCTDCRLAVVDYNFRTASRTHGTKESELNGNKDLTQRFDSGTTALGFIY